MTRLFPAMLAAGIAYVMGDTSGARRWAGGPIPTLGPAPSRGPTGIRAAKREAKKRRNRAKERT